MTDGSATDGTGRGSAAAAAWIFLSVAGISAALTVLFLSMRAVMDIGGYCASGGPYEIATTCPKGVAGLMIASIWGGLIFGGVYVWQSLRAGAPNLIALAWPALFLSLGYNFLSYAFYPPEGYGFVWSWLICGILFVVMGAGPLIAWLLWGRHDTRTPDLPRALAPIISPDVRTALRINMGGRDDDVVGRLERAAALRNSDDITEEEYTAAKAKILSEQGAR
jgi:membrane protein DedA with SNARE-associated domain